MELLEESAQGLEKAERYEMLAEIYKLIIPVYEDKKDFKVSYIYNISTILSLYYISKISLNPSNAEATLVRTTGTQRFLKTTQTLSYWYSLESSR